MSEHFKLEKSEYQDRSTFPDRPTLPLPLSLPVGLKLNISSSQNPGSVNLIHTPFTGFITWVDTGEIEVHVAMTFDNGSSYTEVYTQDRKYTNEFGFGDQIVSVDLTFISNETEVAVLTVELLTVSDSVDGSA
jgi:hypothetical protein